MQRSCRNRAFNYVNFIFTYKFKLLAIKLSQTYLLDIISVFCQSVQKMSTNQKSIQAIERQKHLFPVFLPHFLHIYSNQYWKIKPSMLTLPAKIYVKYLLCYQINCYAITVGLLGLLPSMASFFLQQLLQRKGPSRGFDPGEKKAPKSTDKLSPGV